MASTLKLTLLSGTAALLAMFGAAQAAQAGGRGILVAPIGVGAYGPSMFQDDDDEIDAVSAAAAAATALLDDDEETDVISATADAASALLGDDD